MKRIRILIGVMVTLAVLVIVALVYCANRDYEFTITQKQINDAVLAKFPISKSYLKIFRVTYSNPKVSLLPESNRIEVALDVELEIITHEGAKKFTGNAVMTTGLGYRFETKQFFLSNPQFKQLTIQGVPEQFTEKAADLASSLAREHLQQVTVYTLKPTDVRKKVLKMLLKKVQVEGDELHVTLGL